MKIFSYLWVEDKIMWSARIISHVKCHVRCQSYWLCEGAVYCFINYQSNFERTSNLKLLANHLKIYYFAFVKLSILTELIKKNKNLQLYRKVIPTTIRKNIIHNKERPLVYPKYPIRGQGRWMLVQWNKFRANIFSIFSTK